MVIVFKIKMLEHVGVGDQKKTFAIVPTSLDQSAGPDSPCNGFDNLVFQPRGFKNLLKLSAQVA
jgi:hypothetical protein